MFSQNLSTIFNSEHKLTCISHILSTFLSICQSCSIFANFCPQFTKVRQCLTVFCTCLLTFDIHFLRFDLNNIFCPNIMFACIFNTILMFALLYSDNITFCRPVRYENSIATLLTSRAQRTCARRPLFPFFSEDHPKMDFSIKSGDHRPLFVSSSFGACAALKCACR